MPVDQNSSAESCDAATLADKIAAWSPSSKGPLVFIARERRLIEDALRTFSVAQSVQVSAEKMLDLLQCSTCFRGDVCHSMPCACAQSLADASQPSPAATVETKHKPDMCPTCGINRDSPFPCEHPRSSAGSEPVAWQFRTQVGGTWSNWTDCQKWQFEKVASGLKSGWRTADEIEIRALAVVTNEPQRDVARWPDTLRFDDRDKYIDELEAQIERNRAVPAASDKDLLNWIENEASRGLTEGDAREALTAIKWKIKDGR